MVYAFITSLYVRMAKPRMVPKRDLGGMRVTQLLVKAAKRATPGVVPDVRVVQLVVRYARPAYPMMNWLEDDMFLEDVVFPYDISFGAEAAEVFSTNINTADSGHENRIGRWDQPLLEYNVAFGVRTLEDLHELKRIFRIARGPRLAFRFRDPADYTSSFAVSPESREPDPVTAFDQIIGVGTGSISTFQLVKNYEYGSGTSVRPIRKPEPGTVKVGVRGVELDASDFSVNTATGVVTLLPRTPATVALASMTRVDSRFRLISWSGTKNLSNLRPGDFVRITGFSNAMNSIITGREWEVISVDADASTISFRVPDWGDTSYGVNEAAVTLVTITPVHVPLAGFEVTAGYLFHVPVRFREDRLPVTLEYYGGGSSEVSLIEVRGDEA